MSQVGGLVVVQIRLHVDSTKGENSSPTAIEKIERQSQDRGDALARAAINVPAQSVFGFD